MGYRTLRKNLKIRNFNSGLKDCAPQARNSGILALNFVNFLKVLKLKRKKFRACGAHLLKSAKLKHLKSAKLEQHISLGTRPLTT